MPKPYVRMTGATIDVIQQRVTGSLRIGDADGNVHRMDGIAVGLSAGETQQIRDIVHRATLRTLVVLGRVVRRSEPPGALLTLSALVDTYLPDRGTDASPHVETITYEGVPTVWQEALAVLGEAGRTDEDGDEGEGSDGG